MQESKDEVEVIRIPGGINAESVLAALRGRGIPARARGEAVGKIYGLTLDGLGEVSILVPTEYLDQAREVLEAGETGDLEFGNDEAADDMKPDSD